MKRRITRLAFTVISLLSINSLKAQDVDRINVVTTAVPFLRISPDARAGGMGDIGIATTPDANSAFWNLSKTPFNTNRYGVGLTYTPWLKDLGLNDVYLLAASGFYKLDDDQALSASVRYFSLGNIQFTDNSGQNFGEGRPREFGLDFGYSRKLSDQMGLGIAVRYINSNLVGNFSDQGNVYQAGNAVAGDISLYYNGANEAGQGWSFGAALSNLGSKIGYSKDATQKDFIPANLGLGVAHRWSFDEINSIQLGVDINKLLVPTPPQYVTGGDNPDSVNDALNREYRSTGVLSSWFKSFGDAPGGMSEEMREVQVSLGAEYSYNNQFFARAGYFYEDKTKGNRQYFTLGVGVRYNMFGLNFSYLVPSGSGVNRNPLSNTIRFGLILDLEGESAE